MQDEFDDGPEGEGSLFTTEHLLREALGRDTRVAALVAMELRQKGPIHDLVMFKRDAALSALERLIAVHPQNSGEITILQERVKSFLADCAWIHTKLEAGSEADSQIKEIWGVEHDDRDTDEPD